LRQPSRDGDKPVKFTILKRLIELSGIPRKDMNSSESGKMLEKFLRNTSITTRKLELFTLTTITLMISLTSLMTLLTNTNILREANGTKLTPEHGRELLRPNKPRPLKEELRHLVHLTRVRCSTRK